MKKRIASYLGVICISMIFAATATAETFGKSGKIRYILTDEYYAGCMIHLDSAIGNGCPSNWVSLDCEGLFWTKNKDRGAQRLANAIAAAHSGKRVLLYIDNTKKANGYCAARRIDVIF